MAYRTCHSPALFWVFAILGTFLWIAPTAQASTTLQFGDLIRGTQGSTVYYFGADGKRYVFVNEKSYFSWYPSYTDIRTLPDAELSRLQIGGNVTYKPGVRLLKIDTDPKVYMVTEGGVLRWIENEKIAASLYGGAWHEAVDDLADVFFTNYRIGAPISTPDDINLATVLSATTDINDDKNIALPAVISLTSNGYVPIDVTIEAGQSVQFVNNDTVRHTVTADTLRWGSGTLAPGTDFVHTFNTEGVYSFFDSYNARFTGAIYVTPSTE